MDEMISVTCHCESCNSDFDVPSEEYARNEEGNCPYCGSDQTYGACANYEKTGEGESDATI